MLPPRHPFRRLDRRAILIGLATALAPTTAHAQDGQRRRLGILMPYGAGDATLLRRMKAFREGLERLGWNADRLDLVERWTGDDLKTVAAAAAELAAIPVHAIVTTGSRVVPLVQRATSTIPIVFVSVSDPVGQGLVASLARPGGNTTGISQLEFTDGRSPLVGKQLELIQRLAPAATRALLIFSPENPASSFHVRTFVPAAEALGLAPLARPVRTAADIRDSLTNFAQGAGGMLVVPSDLTLLANRSLIVALAADLRLPAIYSDDSFVHSGGLVSYFADRDDLFRRAAGFVDRVLRGELPATMPVEQPTVYELTINQRTAGALGLPIPPALLAQADEIID